MQNADTTMTLDPKTLSVTVGVVDASGRWAVMVALADVFRLEKAFRDHRRRAEDLILADADGDVAVVGGGEALGINAPADLADLFLQLVFVHF